MEPRFGERHSSVILRGSYADRIREEQELRLLEEKKEQERIDHEDLLEWRKKREGELCASSISSLFSPEFLVSCSNETLTHEDVMLARKHGISLNNPKLMKKLNKIRSPDAPVRQRAATVKSELIDPIADDSDDEGGSYKRKDPLELFRAQRRASREAKLMQEHQAPSNPDNVASTLGVEWTGRRRSKIISKRKQIEEEIAAKSPMFNQMQSTLSISPIKVDGKGLESTVTRLEKSNAEVPSFKTNKEMF